MGYKTTTIAKMMDGIEKRQIYLPAIQRKYVWKVEQIAVLMDSIMHDYPFGTFLFWRVEKEIVNKNNYVLYEFVNSYDERIRQHRDIFRAAESSGRFLVYRIPVDPLFRKAQEAGRIPQLYKVRGRGMKNATQQAIMDLDSCIWR